MKYLNNFELFSIKENTLNEDYYKDTAKLVATRLSNKYEGDIDELFQFIINNKEVIMADNFNTSHYEEMRESLEKSIKIMELLKQYPEEIQKLKDNQLTTSPEKVNG